MVVARKAEPFYTLEEYFEMEKTAEHRSEYYRGEIFAMAGGSANHNRIALNLAASLDRALTGKPCEAFMSDMRLRVAREGLYTYPDVMVTCGKLELVHKRTDTVVNPAVIVEVLSSSTESYDRGRKFEMYRSIRSLREYVLIDQDRVYIEHYARRRGGKWVLTEISDPEGELPFSALELSIPLSEVYRRVEWES